MADALLSDGRAHRDRGRRLRTGVPRGRLTIADAEIAAARIDTDVGADLTQFIMAAVLLAVAAAIGIVAP